MTLSRPLPAAARSVGAPVAAAFPLARHLDLALATVVVMAALALRLPYLWTIPRFTDETREVLLAYEILRGEDPGLVNVDAYIGSLYNWMLALIFWIGGPSWTMPRLLTAVAGALTVGATYGLAASIGGRTAGVVAALLLATSGGHVLSSSHIAWSHCLTPLFATLGAWLLDRAVRLGRPRALAGSGLAFGLALQTHPATLVLLPGATAYLLWRGRRYLSTPWPYLALALFLAAMGNILAYNVISGGGSIETAGEIREHYARGRPLLIGLDTYLANQAVHGLMLLRYLAGAVDSRPGGAAMYLADPSLWLYGGLAGAGLYACARRGAPLPLLMVASSALILPYFNERKYVPIFDGRYLMPVLPLSYAAIGVLAGDLWRRSTDAWSPWRMGWCLMVAGLALYPVVPLARYFEQERLAGRTNQQLIQVVSSAEAARLPHEQVLIQTELRDIKFDGGGTAFRSIRFLLAGAGVPERSVDDVADHVRRQPPGWSALVVLDGETYRELEAERAGFAAFSAVAIPLAAPSGPDGYGLFRVERMGGPRGLPVSQAARPIGPVPVEVFATGLNNPRGLLFRPDGSLLVAEAGSGGPREVDVGRDKPHLIGRTGRISRFTPDGDRFEIARNLPSVVTAVGEEVGPTALAWLDDRLYVLTASGGWDVGDPAFDSGIFEVEPNGSLRMVANISQFIQEHPTRARLEDPRADVPRGMPYGMAVLDGRFYVTDANQEGVLEITPTGEIRRVADYPRSNRALTGIAAGPDGALYVAEFAAQKVTRLSIDGKFTDAATKLRTPIAVAFDREGMLHVLEFTGRVLRTATVGEEHRDILAEGLRTPTAMAFGPDGNLYVSVMGHKADRGAGQIVRLRLQPRPARTLTEYIALALPWLGGLAMLLLGLGIGWRFRQRR